MIPVPNGVKPLVLGDRRMRHPLFLVELRIPT